MQNSIIVLDGEYDNKDACERVLNYALSSKYNVGVAINNTYLYEEINMIANRFRKTRIIYRKDNGRKIYHMVIALNNMYLGCCDTDVYADAVVRYFSDYQVVAVQHSRSDKKSCYWHIHLVLNAVSFKTGKRFYANRTEMYDFASYLSRLTNVKHNVIWDSEGYYRKIYDEDYDFFGCKIY